MTLNEAYLDAPGATVTLNYIPVMTLRLHDMFPSTPDTFPGDIGPFPGLLSTLSCTRFLAFLAGKSQPDTFQI